MLTFSFEYQLNQLLQLHLSSRLGVPEVAFEEALERVEIVEMTLLDEDETGCCLKTALVKDDAMETDRECEIEKKLDVVVEVGWSR
ncbi:hypothetical protein PIB30_018267 [Stylosanthes scabra]|uniref:Uncharacterized protein n=1 Tax=Stylosanthes scabra TaxID=79078 RepID=A0ABU6X9F1_9FABA|nr:hypothetical protein [Stylosanthes scabra]